MISKKILFVICLSCTLLTISRSASAQYDDRPRLLTFQKTRFAEMITRDTIALARLLAEDLIYIQASGVEDNKHSLLKDIASGRIIYQFIIPEKMTATIEGNYAWIYGRANVRFKLSKMTGTIDQYISFMDVYRLKYNQWQLVICHNARLEKNAPYNHNVPQVEGSIQPPIY